MINVDCLLIDRFLLVFLVFTHCIADVFATPFLYPQAEEYLMTSVPIDGIKRSNVCGDGYRIEGALLKSYPYSSTEIYAPYEDCAMTFQARRAHHQIRIRILHLDLNDIHAGTNCLDALRFYKSHYIRRKDKLNSIECGKLNESDHFNLISPTGVVTAHFNTDGGNVSGLGFKVVLTAFRLPNKTHPCNPDDDEYLCHQGDCISRLLLCDGVKHCADGSDENPIRSCRRNSLGVIEDDRFEMERYQARLRQHQHWRGIVIMAFLLIILLAFLFFMLYLLCRRCFSSQTLLIEKPNRTLRVNSNGRTRPSKNSSSSKL